MVVEKLHAGVLVLPLLVVDARLLQLLGTRAFLRLAVHRLGRIRLPLRRDVGIVIVGRVQLRQHLALAHRLAIFHKNSGDSARDLEGALGRYIGLHRSAGGHGNRLPDAIGHAHTHWNRLIGS